MNGDDTGRLFNEFTALKSILMEREHSATEFRTEMRAGFQNAQHALTAHTDEDTRRFEKAAAALDEKVSGLYEHMQKQADAQRARAWQILGIVLAAIFSVVGLVITAHKTGAL